MPEPERPVTTHSSPRRSSRSRLARICAAADLARQAVRLRDGLAGGCRRHDSGRGLRAQCSLVADDRETVRRLVDLGARSDPRALRARDPQPAGAVDDGPAIAAAARLAAHPAVVQPDAAIGIGERRVVVADDERGRALLVHELADQGVDERGRGGIELARPARRRAAARDGGRARRRARCAAARRPRVATAARLHGRRGRRARAANAPARAAPAGASRGARAGARSPRRRSDPARAPAA